jgi:type II secretory pathway pseudopilin PulG
MIVVGLLSFLIAIAVPTFYRARELSRMRSCQENLHKTDGAKEQYALERNAAPGTVIGWSDLVGVTSYLRKTPACPGSGTYSINPIGENPSCSLSAASEFPHTFEATPPGGGGTP